MVYMAIFGIYANDDKELNWTKFNMGILKYFNCVHLLNAMLHKTRFTST